jgi:hypothetical protein
VSRHCQWHRHCHRAIGRASTSGRLGFPVEWGAGNTLAFPRP